MELENIAEEFTVFPNANIVESLERAYNLYFANAETGINFKEIFCREYLTD